MGNYISHQSNSSWSPRLFRWLKFHLTRPLAVVAFKIRQRRARNQISPRRWLSPGELLTRDLENYEPQGTFTLDLKFIEDFAKARDELLAQIKKQMIFSLVAFAFSAAKYFDIKLNVNVAGFSLADTPGVLETLLLISNLLACYTLMLQGNVFLIENTMKHAIDRSIPDELKNIYRVRYFPHENFGLYQSFNLPHIIPSRATRTIGKYTAILYLILLFAITIAFTGCNIALLFYFLYLHPQLGVFSYALLALILSCGICSFFYLLLTRFRLPYLDFTLNHELELLEQVNPDRHKIRLNEIFGQMNADRRRMEELGYLKKRI